MKKEIILIGGGGHCRSCIDVIEQQNVYKILGILDIEEKIGCTISGYKIVGTDENISKYAKLGFDFLITIGQIHSSEKRRKIYSVLREMQLKLAVIVSPISYTSQKAQIGDGTIIHHHALVNAGARIGTNCIINSKSLVEHDAVIEDHCHVSTGAVINGGTTIGKGCFVGSNATVKNGVHVGENCVIGAGVKVMENLNPGTWLID